MCKFASLFIDESGRVICGDLNFHDGGVPEAHGLLPADCREAEWIGDDPSALSVRTTSDEPHNESWWASLILAQYPTRSRLLAALTVGRALNSEYHYRDGLLHRDGGPAWTITYADGDRSEHWYCEGKQHRDGGPACTVTYPDGRRREYWYREGKLQNYECSFERREEVPDAE